jgi:uncharacterized protein (DUF305 family)
MNKFSIALVGSIIIISLMLGVMVGYYMTPEYRDTMWVSADMGLGRADRLIDLRYINAMAAHHRGAILLAEQAAKNSNRKEITDLAAAIQEGEPKLIAELYSWKSDWYNDTRIVRDPKVAQLGERGDSFDLRFLNALIAHHEAGILMTKEIRTKSGRAEVLNNADAVESFLAGSIDMLKGWRTSWYGIK